MKFTVNTKPLKNVIGLGIIRSNVSNFYKRSQVVQMTATQDSLILNIEASSIKTRMVLHGSGDEDVVVSTMVDCLKFKQLIDSIDTTVVFIEFIPGGLSIRAGNSKFSIPQTMDTADVSLDEPMEDFTPSEPITLRSSDWQFVKDHQMYAISKKEEHPVYTNVWVSQDHDILVGDFDIGRFTYSHQGTLDTTCLLPTSLINLFTSIPDNSIIYKVGRSYILNVETDSYSMVTEFLPKYEDDDSVGNYNSAIILSRLVHPDKFMTINAEPIIKFLNQTNILNQSERDKILDVTFADGKLTIANRVGSFSVDTQGVSDFTIKFNLDLFKGVISNFDSATLNMAPLMGTSKGPDGQIIQMPVGCIFWTDKLTAMLAGGRVDV